MIIYITSIRHPINSRSYTEVCEILTRTLHSYLNQSDPDFKVVIVCNKLPVHRIDDPRFDFVLVDFPPPSTHRGPNTGLAAVRKDKASKYVIGLVHAQRYSADYIMFIDADDFIHRELTGFLNAHKGENGFYIERGYSYRSGQHVYAACSDFYRWCGTCNILNPRLLTVADHLDVRSDQDTIMGAFDREYFMKILGAHPFSVDYYALHGLPLRPVPFAAAVYVRGTGENHSQALIAGRPRLLNHDFLREFGFDVPISFSTKLKGLLAELPREIYQVVRSLHGSPIRNYWSAEHIREEIASIAPFGTHLTPQDS